MRTINRIAILVQTAREQGSGFEIRAARSPTDLAFEVLTMGPHGRSIVGAGHTIDQAVEAAFNQHRHALLQQVEATKAMLEGLRDRLRVLQQEEA